MLIKFKQGLLSCKPHFAAVVRIQRLQIEVLVGFAARLERCGDTMWGSGLAHSKKAGKVDKTVCFGEILCDFFVLFLVEKCFDVGEDKIKVFNNISLEFYHFIFCEITSTLCKCLESMR